MLQWKPSSSTFVRILDSPLFSFSLPFFFHAVSEPYLLDDSDMRHLPCFTITCFGSSGWILSPVGPECLEKTRTRKKCERQSITRYGCYLLLFSFFSSSSSVLVFNTVWQTVSLCCGCAICRFCFLFFFPIFGFFGNLDMLTDKHQICLLTTGKPLLMISRRHVYEWSLSCLMTLAFGICISVCLCVVGYLYSYPSTPTPPPAPLRHTGCQRPVGLSRGKAKVCCYSGWYYCQSCHQDNLFLIPARLLHNWDTSKHKVPVVLKLQEDLGLFFAEQYR